jgi:hypothetical protein
MLVRTMRIKGVVQVGILYGPTLRRVSRWAGKRGGMILPEVRVRLVCLHHFRGQEQEDPDTVCVSITLNSSRTQYDIPRAHD